jgi:hypothetical protein
MLAKARISKIKILSDEWFDSRLGKFTSSEIHFLMNDKFLTTGMYSYVFRKVGEVLTGESVKGEIETDAMRWGAAEEANAVKKFAIHYGISQIVCQQLITEPGSRFGSTPDGIIVHGESTDQLKYDVSTVEVKCPPTYASYIGLALCETPQNLKWESRQYYWQVLDQMDNCDCLNGYFVAYHPKFKQGGMRIIEFRKMQEWGVEDGKKIQYPIVKDIALLKARKQLAVEKFDEIKEKLSRVGMIQPVSA